MSKLVRVSDEAYSRLNSIARVAGISKQEVLDSALEKWEKDMLLKQANVAYDAMRKNKQEWEEEQEELQLWDTALDDGLQDE